MSVAAVVLAAGASTRLGQPKQNLRLGVEKDGARKQETLLERTMRIAHLAALDPVFVVVAPTMEYLADAQAIVLINEAASEGMASSIRTGIAAAISAEVDGVVILACDQPAVTAKHLRELASGGLEVVASAYAGRKGVPAYFPRGDFAELMKLLGDSGARELLRSARAVALNKGELDIDTADDLRHARELYTDDPLL